MGAVGAAGQRWIVRVRSKQTNKQARNQQRRMKYAATDLFPCLDCKAFEKNGDKAAEVSTELSEFRSSLRKFKILLMPTTAKWCPFQQQFVKEVFDWHTEDLRTPQSQGDLKKEGLVESEEVFMMRFDKGNGEN